MGLSLSSLPTATQFCTRPVKAVQSPRSRPGGTGLCCLSSRPVLSEHSPEGIRYLAEGGEISECFFHRVEQVLGAFGCPLEVGEGPLYGTAVAGLPQYGEPLPLPLAARRLDPAQIPSGGFPRA